MDIEFYWKRIEFLPLPVPSPLSRGRMSAQQTGWGWIECQLQQVEGGKEDQIFLLAIFIHNYR
jgi:hypothetical protein